MTRETVRTLKQAVRTGARSDAEERDRMLSPESAQALLARSIEFGHRRLAVLRLAVAVDVMAQISGEQWQYCSRAAQASNDVRLQEVYRYAAFKASASREVSSRPQ